MKLVLSPWVLFVLCNVSKYHTLVETKKKKNPVFNLQIFPV